MKRATPPPPPDDRNAPHEGRAYTRGMSVGIRLLRDALARGDAQGAKKLIDLAERKAAGGRRE